MKKKKTNKDRDKGIIWCMTEIYARKIEAESFKGEQKSIKLAIEALQGQIKDINDKLGDSHKD
tara:strand:+ start:17 stop:205 length:189 start_codon:yes stop_codon:yes gene_type:complete